VIARASLVAVLIAGVATATAAPKRKDARTQFDKGVAAYTKGDYAAASEALGASYVLEADVETLFAWAQTERKLGHCDRAIDLYKKLLAMELPAENKHAIKVQIQECKDLIADQKKSSDSSDKADQSNVDKPDKGDKGEPDYGDKSDKPAESDKSNPTVEPVPVAPVETAQVVAEPTGQPEVVVQPEPRSWWKDPVGGALVGVGAVGLGVGVVFLVQAGAANADKAQATDYPRYEELANRAESRGRFGVISLAAGGALAIGGIIWYATRSPSQETRVTTVVVPSGAGLAVSGSF
jgi:hypothetical protein